MAEIPFANYRLTARLELRNKPGFFASIVNVLAREKVNIGAVDLVEATRTTLVRDITFDVLDENHGKRVIEQLRRVRGVKVISISDQIFLAHLGGKISIQMKFPITTRNRLSMLYTPGVARVAEAIHEKPAKIYSLTIKSNSVAVVSDGSAVLGLGNLGPEAALPVMEGKCMIFKQFANIDAWPICLATQDEEEVIRTVRNIAPVFGAINLEDIAAPRCFTIEERLKEVLDIPVMHDDQHGTAVVILAALKNALRLVKKSLQSSRVVVAGMGAAGIACCRILLAEGVGYLIGCDRQGVVLEGKGIALKSKRRQLPRVLQWKNQGRPLKEALEGADVFIGLSTGNILEARELRRMKKDAIVFAMANPIPEIDPYKALKYCRIFATGRSDFPNQINNALAFPGIFRGALNVRASAISEGMKLAAANAIASLIAPQQLNEEYIIPSIFDKRVVESVAYSVAHTAVRSGLARRSKPKQKAFLEEGKRRRLW